MPTTDIMALITLVVPPLGGHRGVERGGIYIEAARPLSETPLEGLARGYF